MNKQIITFIENYLEPYQIDFYEKTGRNRQVEDICRKIVSNPPQRLIPARLGRPIKRDSNDTFYIPNVGICHYYTLWRPENCPDYLLTMVDRFAQVYMTRKERLFIIPKWLQKCYWIVQECYDPDNGPVTYLDK